MYIFPKTKQNLKYFGYFTYFYFIITTLLFRAPQPPVKIKSFKFQFLAINNVLGFFHDSLLLCEH